MASFSSIPYWNARRDNVTSNWKLKQTNKRYERHDKVVLLQKHRTERLN